MNEGHPVRLVAVGDVMLGRGVRDVDVGDAAQLFSPDLLQHLEGDIVTGNLECLIGLAGTPSPTSHSHFQGDPIFSKPLIERFDVVSLANNHTGDFGDDAIEETLEWLSHIGVRAVGVGRSLAEAHEPVTFDIRGCRVAVFGATTVGTLTNASRYKLAEPGSELYRRVRAFRQSGHSCILHLHAGGGDVCYPSPAIRSLIDEVLDSGFSIILGHHPHIVQGFLDEPDRKVFFSLGDFLFDKTEDGRDQAMLVVVDIGADGTLSDPEIRIAQRTRDLHLKLLDGDAHEQKLGELRILSDMIRSGASDKAYLEWRGGKIARLAQSLLRDWQVGGGRALRAKLGRVNRRKLGELFLKR